MCKETEKIRRDIPWQDRADEQPHARIPYQTETALRGMSEDEILSELFSYHAPTPEQLPKYAAINQAAKNFAAVLLQVCPPCADRTRAIRHIQDARMIANMSVALNGLSL